MIMVSISYIRLSFQLFATLLIITACSEQPRTVNKNITVIDQGTRSNNNIRNYLINVAGNITNSSLNDFQDVEDWNNVKEKRHQQFVEMLSLTEMPLKGERPALNVKITGTVQMDGYRIEKLYYESLPGLYVPANLYIPDDIDEPTAAVLYLCGHSHSQKVHYQAHPHKLAKLGFVCLVPETIQYGEVWGEHWGCYANGWFNWYSRGYTPAGVEVWNAIRGLDLLSARSEVDGEKMGATGISGGGAISWFLAAIDQRIKAVAPVCGASTLLAQIHTRTIDGHCDCMTCINTYGWDIPDIGALIAPRPLLIAQADRDGLNQVESVREIYDNIQSFYGLLGAPDNVSFIETPGGHSYHKKSREGIFSFLLKHLQGIEVNPEDVGDIDESPEAVLPEDQLAVYTIGIPEDDLTPTIQDSFLKLATPRKIDDINDLIDYQTDVRQSLMERTFHNFPETKCELVPEKSFRTSDGATHGQETYHITTELGWSLKAKIYWRIAKSTKSPLMIILRQSDELKGASEHLSYQLNDRWNVAIIDVRGIGESGWSPDLQWHVRRASAWTGRTIASMRVYDLLRFIEFFRSLPGVDPAQIGVAGKGEMGVVALYGALLDGKLNTVIVQDPVATQNVTSSKDGRGDAIEMLNCLRITDVNQLPALIHPTSTVFVGDIPESYLWSINSVKNISSRDSIIKVDTLEQLKEVL